MEDRNLCRGKAYATGEFETGFYVYGQGKHYILADSNGGGYDPRHEETAEWQEVDPNTLGQSTGLRDKNGTLVFEGNVVTRIALIYETGKNEPIGKYQAVGVVSVVESGNEPPGWVVKTHDHRGNKMDAVLFVKPSGWNEPWYVISNIHDNPELLEVQDEH
jgi:uncharacterized phage protein (TIGR01671 family)